MAAYIFEPACWAFPCLRRQDAAAFGAKLDDWFPVRAALVEVSIGLAVVEGVEMNIGHEPETLVIAGMVEDDQMIPALAGAQPAADGLDESDARPRWPCVDDTSDVQVNTCVQRRYIADELGFTRPKLFEYFLSIE